MEFRLAYFVILAEDAAQVAAREKNRPRAARPADAGFLPAVEHGFRHAGAVEIGLAAQALRTVRATARAKGTIVKNHAHKFLKIPFAVEITEKLSIVP